MRLKGLIAAAALPALIASPVLAANPAASLSLRGTVAEAAQNPETQSRVNTVVLGGLILIAVIVGAVALGGSHDDETPASA